ncbi:MAG: helix-turn-helix domain-containing protein [Candidatus Omnitrophota bacterium]
MITTDTDTRDDRAKELLRKDIGLRMKKIRKTLGYTQDEMVSHFDIGRANYSRIEKGEIFPGVTIMNTLKVEFGVSLDWLVSNIGEMFQQEPVDDKNDMDFGEYSEEIMDLLLLMEKITVLKHSILSFYIEYKIKNKELIERLSKVEVENTIY